MATYVSLIAIAAVLTVAARATGPGSIEPSVRDNRIGLKVERRATNRVLERRCRPGRHWPAVRSVWAIPRRHVEAVLQRELRRQQYARTLSSRCLSSPAAVIRHVFPAATEDGAVRVARCESRLYARATGAAGERGLFQIHPVHFGWLDEWRLWEPLYNTRIALRMSNGGVNWSAWTCGWAA